VNNCNGNGLCNEGRCVCNSKYRGHDCSIPKDLFLIKELRKSSESKLLLI